MLDNVGHLLHGAMSSQNLTTASNSPSTFPPIDDWRWPLWPLVPLYPYGQRRTLRQEVLPNTLWTFDQLQGILYVVTPIRMTVIRLQSGGLLVYAPVAPTPECLRLMEELVTAHGAVRYIILPTTSGLEHKVFVGPFARRFPEAQVYVAPDQWSFPLNLPWSWLGLPRHRTYPLPQDSTQAPFADEFDYAILGSISLGIGAFEEVAFYHRPTKTLLVTDTIVRIPEEPPAIVQLDPTPLLFHARDQVGEPVVDTPAMRRKGWQRIALFAFYFRPSALKVMPFWESLRAATQSPLRQPQFYWGWYPFQWRLDWQRSFEALRGDGRLLVAPILQTLILNRAPQKTLDWVNQVATWDFQQIIPCHFDLVLDTSPSSSAANATAFRQAFQFLDPAAKRDSGPKEDFALLHQIEATLQQRKIIPPRA